MSGRIGSIVIEAVAPRVDGGRYPVKRIVGERVAVRADIFKEGHDVLAAVVRYRQRSPRALASDWVEVPMRPLPNDAWEAELPLEQIGEYAFTVEAWTDTYRSFAGELSRRVAAGQRVGSELLEGAALLEAAARRARPTSPANADRLVEAARELGKRGEEAAAQLALSPMLVELASRHPDRANASRYDQELTVRSERPRARTSAWYEFFPRSATRDKARHGTFRDCEAWLPEIEFLGFDTVYLPPIHPIGRTARKGKNNSPRAEPGDVGSPWAIGGAEGGHKAIHPELGTFDDFRRFLERASAHGLEVALDLAFQCSPDHPYLREHPEWFQRRPDGTIKTAENPPKRYEDIVNFDWLGPAREALWEELRSVVLFWVEAGVRIFRVDNPHTKPVAFWEWLLGEVHALHPEVIFLAEAFTRPKMMKVLAKVGFSQSYTYFTWRNFKGELQEYLEELTTPPVSEYMRGNLWPNTPDILPQALQGAPPAAFRIRVALAATLSSSYGIYSGYELCEGRALPEKEEYLDSEKYQLQAWDPERPGNIRSFVAALNHLRRENRALQLYANLRFFRCDNERVLCYLKATADRENQLLVVVSLDPFSPQQPLLHLPLEELGLGEDETYQVHELLGNERALWQGPTARVDLSPDRPAAIYRVLRFRRSEHAFDYFE